MTEAEIRALEGEALTLLAYELGLAPEGVRWDASWVPHVPGPCWEEDGILCPISRPWHPHKDLAQALMLFHSLQGRDVSTTQEYYARLGYGELRTLSYRQGNNRENYVEYGAGTGMTEAHALTLCAVLAMVGGQ